MGRTDPELKENCMAHDRFFNPPCIGCGYCCLTAMCVRGCIEYGVHKRCPGLIWNGGRYWCNLVLSKPILRDDIAIGAGCCSTMFNTYRDIIRRCACIAEEDYLENVKRVTER